MCIGIPIRTRHHTQEWRKKNVKWGWGESWKKKTEKETNPERSQHEHRRQKETETGESEREREWDFSEFLGDWGPQGAPKKHKG